MKPITKQLIVAAFILALVTVASVGIRKARFSAHRARTVEGPVVAATEPAPLPAESPAVDAEPEPQYADVAEQEEAPAADYSEAKPSKGDYAKAGGLQKISWGDNENLYITAKGETWYVGKGPDGKITKTRVEIDQATGKMTVVGGGKSGGPQKVSLGGNDNIYITEEGQTWYVTEGSKAQVEIDDSTGEITVLEQYGGDDDK
jgi:hypothetical protein